MISALSTAELPSEWMRRETKAHSALRTALSSQDGRQDLRTHLETNESRNIRIADQELSLIGANEKEYVMSERTFATDTENPHLPHQWQRGGFLSVLAATRVFQSTVLCLLEHFK